MKGKIYIGTSGWNYRHWKGPFYPEEVKQEEMLDHYVRQFNSVELNNSFYKLPDRENFIKWRKSVPDDFIISMKANRFITHMKKLKDPQETLKEQLTNMQGLGQKLGPLLFQLPPLWNANTERLVEFLLALPRKFRYAFEFRHPSWYDESIYRLLAKYNCAFCIYHLAGHLSPIKVTADFVYVRLHGPEGKYQGNYSAGELRQWAHLCNDWSEKGKDVYFYFDNDEAGYAPLNAKKLSQLLSNA
jgi:uncharacterized protein YecE (DUF72 family)